MTYPKSKAKDRRPKHLRQTGTLRIQELPMTLRMVFIRGFTRVFLRQSPLACWRVWRLARVSLPSFCAAPGISA